MKFALAGNPNCGKTTLFNSLTGATAHVGNWPGVTVDKREGIYKKLEEKVSVIDLPGIYSLSPYTPEEVVSRNYILDEKPDCIINVVDATNLERNLYLTTQLLEIDVPMVVALNMMDVVENTGRTILVKELEKKLKVRVVEISALKNKGLDKLMDVAYNEAKKERVGYTVLENSRISGIITTTTNDLKNENIESPLFHAVKLIENDELEIKMHEEIARGVASLKAKETRDEFDGDYEAIVADERYKYISSKFSSLVIRPLNEDKVTKSDKIDRVLTHKIWGIPIFLVIMFIIFHFVFSEDLLFLNSLFGLEIENVGWINFFTGIGAEVDEEGVVAALEGIPSLGVFLQSWMGWLTGSIIDLFASFMPEGTWYTGLVCDGLLTGLDAIFSFLPQILLLFLFISILEDSGYMARVAFIMDRAFRKFGLSGKAFIPLLMGFGCSVPAMMGAKTLEDERERDITIRLTPFFSCGAKAPIWAMLAFAIAGSFLGDIFVFSIYLLGIVVAIIAAIIMKLFSKNYEVPPFIMELPSYHAPQFRNLIAHLWEKLKHFVYKASTIITAAIILIWFLSSFGWAFWNGMVEEIDDSILASIGKVFSYFFYPLGWSQGSEGWKFSVATITGLIAKEDVVATMAQLGLCDEAGETILFAMSNAKIYSFAAYNLFTFPCFAAIATAKSESSKKAFPITLVFWFFGSYVISLFVFLIGLTFEAAWWIGLLVVLAIISLFVLSLLYISKKRKNAVLAK